MTPITGPGRQARLSRYILGASAFAGGEGGQLVPPSPPAGGEQSRSASLPRHRREASQTPQTRAQGTSLGGPAPTGARNQSGRTDASGCKQPTLLSSKVHAPDNGAHTKRRALKAPTACTNYLNRFHKNHNRFRTLCAPSFSCLQRGVWRGQFLCGPPPRPCIIGVSGSSLHSQPVRVP